VLAVFAALTTYADVFREACVLFIVDNDGRASLEHHGHSDVVAAFTPLTRRSRICCSLFLLCER
jgi:hypothetical protein